MKKRLNYIDVVKFICIFGVMFDHCQYLGVDLILNLVIPFRVWIMSFYLQVFFICSGITSFKTSTEDYTKKYCINFVIKKFNQLIIPYFLWGVIFAPNINWDILKGLIIGTNISIEAVRINGILWFLPVMFMSSLIFEFILILSKKTCKSDKTFHILYSGLAIMCMICSYILYQNRINLIFGLNIALTGVGLMVIGFYLRKFSIDIINYDKKYIFLLLLLIPITFMLAQINMPHTIENTEIVYEYEVWMARGCYGKSYILFLLISILNFLWLLAVGVLLQKVKQLVFLGKHTMILMVTHSIIFENICYPVSQLLQKIGFRQNEYYIFAIVLCLITILFQYPICKFVEKFTPNLEGR